MDFFEAQDRARRRTGTLIVYFVLAVLGIVGGMYAATVGAIISHERYQYAKHHHRLEESYPTNDGDLARYSWWQPDVLGWATLGTLVVVGCAAGGKWLAFRAGGPAVARTLGGRPVDPHTTDFRERQLLNVVEEMAIASGLPMPAVFVLDDEPSINAFAAGLTSADAVVTVSRGAMEQLSRDELQGVVGHEFSHILNGDMRLNLRIAALVFGILAIAIIGRGLLRAAFYGRASRSRDRGGSSTAALAAAGLTLMILGYIGWIFGRMIQAAVSRQREFLADASSVQFTRNPAGLVGALTRIQKGGSALHHAGAPQLAHLFFAKGFDSWSPLWATHPPLAVRIAAIDPTGTLAAAAASAPAPQAPGVPAPATTARATIPFTPRAGAGGSLERTLVAATVVSRLGTLTDDHVTAARDLLGGLPTSLKAAAENPSMAQALVCAILLGREGALRSRQLGLVSNHGGADLLAKVERLLPDLGSLDPAARLPLVQLALPSLRSLTGDALSTFLSTLDELVHADGEVSLFEFAMQKVIARHLHLSHAPSSSFGATPSPSSIRTEIGRVLSALALAGGEAEAPAAYAAGIAKLSDLMSPPAFVHDAHRDLGALDAALDRLTPALPGLKRRILQAAVTTIGHDGTITRDEDDMLRATAAALDCPVPLAA